MNRYRRALTVGSPVLGAIFGMMLLVTAAATQPAPSSYISGAAPPMPPRDTAPRSPAAPRSPGAPSAPPSVAGTVAMDELVAALLLIDARSPRRSAAVVGLADGLQIVAGVRRGETSAGSGRLATVLSETLRGRRLVPATRDALALGLAGAMAAPGGAELERALASVRAALAAAGVGDVDILLVDRELRRGDTRR